MQNEFTRQSNYNGKRRSYANEDCTEYTYVYEDGTAAVIRAGENGVTIEMIAYLDKLDKKQDLEDRYNDEHIDGYYQGFNPSAEDKDDYNPWLEISEVEYEVTEIDPRISKLEVMVRNDLTDSQRDLYHKHFGMQKQLEEIRQEEALITGRLVTHQAMTNRENKIIERGAKCLGVTRVKRRKTKGGC